ncbi:hypothetical protein BLOT_003294 [Blomia tropicalis]|nr:hypothetical protein BLOT_003294 [Blomia tropicalis]
MRHGRVMTNNGQLYYPYLKLEDLKLIERKAMNCTKKIINDVRTEMLDSILFRAHKWCDFNHTLSVSKCSNTMRIENGMIQSMIEL